MRILHSLLLEMPQAESEFEQQVFEFCQLWRSGQKEFLFYSSGSTGDPKPISISRERLYASAIMTGEWLQLVKGDVALLSLPPTYIAGAMVLVRTLVLDLGLVLVEPCQNPLENFPPTTIHLASFVPTQWSTMLDVGINFNNYFSQAKGILLGGARVPEKLRIAMGFPVYETYGMTETVSHIAFRTWNQDYFQTLPGIQIALSDTSCLLICSVLTENRWLETRDVVEMEEPGKFRLVGRLDRVINSGGLKIQPEKIEGVYSSLTKAPLFAAGIPDEFWGAKVVLFVESAEFIVFDRDYIQSRLASHEVPKEIVILPSFIKTTSGKIDTAKTVTLYLNSI
ncbi:MAG: o-succinylbenzoate--CoA ligase [Bacteroidota bacterium]|jgi:O-succinylbenzoic acid--CoA ligase